MSRRIALSLGALVIAASLLTGCTISFDPDSSPASEESASGTSVPEGFPSDVALPEDAELVVSIDLNGDYELVYNLTDAAEGERVAQELESTFGTPDETTAGGSTVWTFADSDYDITLTLTDGDPATLTYTVGTAG
ncbi:hypothetical protein [Agromyces sp. SYSU T00194]|uniref:hypothetical protein n=1 Tax=Agromyces chitinivorans TaxID=3158560 RepID=UPI0033982B1D